MRFIMGMMLWLGLAGGGAAAGPFGIDIEGFNPSTYACVKSEGSFFKCTGFPAQHPDIETYVVQFHHDIGLCFIKGISKTIHDSRYGENTRRAVDEIYAQLRPKYGTALQGDELRSGSIWDEPEDWMMGIIKSERKYYYMARATPEVDGVAVWGVFASALDTTKSYWSVEFQTSKSDACNAQDRATKGNVF